MGIENAKKEVDRLTDEAIKALAVFNEDTAFLKDFALKLSNRNK